MKKNKKYILLTTIILLLFIGYTILDNLLFNGIKPISINENGFQADYFVKKGIKKKTAVILIGGGAWGDYWAIEFANKEMVGLSIPYIGKKNLPKLLEKIELTYFKNAIDWLKKQPEVNPKKIVVMGASRNAELALILASKFTNSIHGVVAYAPSSVSWSNTVLPYNSNQLKPSWIYKGDDIPYIPMDKITGNDSNKIKLLNYWKNGLTKTTFINKASIQVEKIKGPILLFSGKDDKVWPSSIMADMIEKRLKDNNFKYFFQNIKYEGAGHLISNNPTKKWSDRTGIININGKEYEYEFGGSNADDFKAKQDAKIKLMEFIEKI